MDSNLSRGKRYHLPIQLTLGLLTCNLINNWFKLYYCVHCICKTLYYDVGILITELALGSSQRETNQLKKKQCRVYTGFNKVTLFSVSCRMFCEFFGYRFCSGTTCYVLRGGLLLVGKAEVRDCITTPGLTHHLTCIPSSDFSFFS